MKYILKDGEPLPVDDVLEWSKWFGDIENRRVARDEFPGCYVSTIFLGIDHQFGDGPPLLFETMVFGGSCDEDMDRYATLPEARVGHRRICEKVRAAAANTP